MNLLIIYLLLLFILHVYSIYPSKPMLGRQVTMIALSSSNANDKLKLNNIKKFSSIDLNNDNNNNNVLHSLSKYHIIQRIPIALFAGIGSALSAFLSSFLVITPVGLLVNIKQIRTPSLWWQSAYKMGYNWSQISAIFSGGEILVENLRAKSDSTNRYIGSGLGSAMLAANDGPMAMLNGFAVGYAFLYMIDKFTDSNADVNAGRGAPHPLNSNSYKGGSNNYKGIKNNIGKRSNNALNLNMNIKPPKISMPK